MWNRRGRRGAHKSLHLRELSRVRRRRFDEAESLLQGTGEPRPQPQKVIRRHPIAHIDRVDDSVTRNRHDQGVRHGKAGRPPRPRRRPRHREALGRGACAAKNYDVFGHDLKIRIECGHTKGKRIFDLLPLPYEEVMSEFWVLRYHYIGIKNNLFKFKPNLDKLKDFENYIKNHMKKNNEYKEKHGSYPEYWNPELSHKLTPFVDPKDAIWHLINGKVS